MRHALSVSLMVLAAFAFGACGDKDAPTPKGGPSGKTDPDGVHDHDADHDHDHDHDHGDDHDHGERHELGSAKAGSYTIQVAVFGEVEAGHEAVLDIEVQGGEVSTLRAWVGVESGKGSLKAKVDGESGDYHGHIEVPATLPEGSAVWIEVEAADGSRHTASFDIA